MHFIEEIFGANCNLYKDVLNCDKDADKAALRKAYYRTALKHHPDKNPGNEEAASRFQAVTAAYQLLQNEEFRQEYDQTGKFPLNNDDYNNDDDENTAGVDQWKQYFDTIFGRVTTSDIDAFAAKYKCSDEERRDVIKFFKARKGNLVQMLECVILSEARDAARWVEDYIQPEMKQDRSLSKYKDAMQKSLKKLQKQIEKEEKEAAEEEDDEEEEEEVEAMEAEEDSEDTETESEDDEPRRKNKNKNNQKKKANQKSKEKSPKKSKPTQTKTKTTKKKKDDNMQDLIAAIQNKRRGGGGGGGANFMANLGSRYGVDMPDDDPLTDEQFSKVQSKLKKRK